MLRHVSRVWVMCLVGFAVAACGASWQVEELPFTLPVPDGWRTETIPFPLEFAPELPYVGLEELRFAPGMFEEESEEFWTYVFVWWVQADAPTELDVLARHLEDYYRGLAVAVAESRDSEVGDSAFSVSLLAGNGNGFTGTAETLDAFVTQEQVHLNLRGDTLDCLAQDRRMFFFALSPQPEEHPVWEQLAAIRDGFRCSS